jgi:hypothetical protein
MAQSGSGGATPSTCAMQPVEIQKEYLGPPKGSKYALTQRLYKIKFNDGSLQAVLAEDTIYMIVSLLK